VNPVVNAALSSWTFNGLAITVLVLTALTYTRGWLRGRQLLRSSDDAQQFATFQAGLLLVFVATESPLEAFDSLLLSAHMTQHLLLMMLAPPLILLGRPTLPLLRGLPKRFVEEIFNNSRITALHVGRLRIQHDFLAFA
jgi:cytochrome c oxidase assembly factor CtaG